MVPHSRNRGTRTNLSLHGSKKYARLFGTSCGGLLHVVCQVRDEKGRRRLHGAFTGGFSAGYYNTVGSKEGACFVTQISDTAQSYIGWTPSTFTSTRGERAKQKAARPEDYMDEEDLKELEESRAAGMQEKVNLLEGTPAESKRRGLVAIDPEEECVHSIPYCLLLP